MEKNRLINADRIFIIGGGPSARGLDFQKLVGYGYLLGVNDSFLHTPCNGLASMDGRWVFKRSKEIKAAGIDTFLSRRHAEKWMGKGWAWDGVTLLEVDHLQHGMSETHKKIYAKHSGAVALNVAYLARPKEIYLFGFDHTDDRKSGEYSEHWYGQYEWRPKRTTYYHMNPWIEDHEVAASQFKKSGIWVFNVSQISKIKAYPKIDFDDVLGRVSAT